MDAARQVASLIPAHARIAISVENRSTDDNAASDLKSAIEDQVQSANAEIAADGQPLRIVLGQSVRGLVVSAQFGAKSVVIPWRRTATTATVHAKLTATSMWTQSEQILDVLTDSSAMLIVEPTRASLYRRTADTWQLEKSAPLNFPSPMPRDPRARISGTLESFRIFSTAGSCSGSVTPQLTVNCSDANPANPWVPGRNYMHDAALGDYYAIAVGSAYAPIAGGARLITTQSPVNSRGGELAAIESQCGVTWLSINNTGTALNGMSANGNAITDPLSIDGTLREIWQSDSSSAAVHAILFHPQSRSYELLRVAISCTE